MIEARRIAANIAKLPEPVAEVIGIQNSECDKEGGRTRPGFGP